MPAKSKAQQKAAGAALASVQLQLAAEAGKTALPGSAIFVIVRAVGADRGPPLAAKKVSAADFDKPVLLTVADAMIGGAGLKAGTEVVIQARLSLNGQPAPQPGDWQSAKNTLRLPAGTLKLAIDQVIDK